jgi:hypothetical protein
MNYRVVSQKDIVLIARQPIGLKQKQSSITKDQFKRIKQYVERISEQNLTKITETKNE